eukprot:6006984-Pyramimonas_sp.AAC.1
MELPGLLQDLADPGVVSARIVAAIAGALPHRPLRLQLLCEDLDLPRVRGLQFWPTPRQVPLENWRRWRWLLRGFPPRLRLAEKLQSVL